MKNNIIILSIIMALLLIGQAAFAKDFKINFKVNLESLETAPASYYVYEAPSKKEIASNAKKLWMNLNKQTNADLDLTLLDDAENADRIQINTEEIFFDVYSAVAPGYIYTKSLSNYFHPQGVEVKSRKLPDKNKAAEMAKDYLSLLEILPTDSTEMYVAKVSKIRMATSQTASEIYDMMQVVYFGRKINGLSVVGPTRIVVRIGDNGELVGVINNWPKVTKKEIKGKNAVHGKSAWKGVATKHLEDAYANSDFTSVNLETAEVVLYDDGEGCIEPSILAKGKQIHNNGEAAEYDWLIPIVVAPKAKYKGINLGSRDDQDAEEIR